LVSDTGPYRFARLCGCLTDNPVHPNLPEWSVGGSLASMIEPRRSAKVALRRSPVRSPPSDSANPKQELREPHGNRYSLGLKAERLRATSIRVQTAAPRCR
jgi:hypothetical protein